jgi:type I restriction enzyme S subunit
MNKYYTHTQFPDIWISKIPAHWQVHKMKRLFAERSEKGYPNEPLLVASQNMGVVPKNVYGNRTVEAQKDLHLLKLVHVGDFVISLRSFQGGLEYAYYQGIISPAYTILIPHEPMSGSYFRYLAKSKPFIGLLTLCVTGIREGQNIDYAKMKNHLLPVPPREEQDQIVRFLDWKVSSINRLINIKQEQLRKVKELLDRLFRDTTSKCSKKVKIKYLFELDDDFFVPDASESYAKAGMYNRGRGIFLREPCLGNELGDSQFQYIHSDRLMLSGQFAWEDAVYITQEKDTHGIASHRYYLLKPVRYIPVEYLWLYFLSGEGFFNLQQCSHGSAGRNRPLNIKEVLNLELPVPDDKEKANALNELVRDYMRLQVITEEEKKALLDFKTHLVADIVTGKIDVRGIEIPEYEFVDEDADADNEDDGEEDTEEQED